MSLPDLLSRIVDRAQELGFSRRELCLRAGLKADAIRLIERGHTPRRSTLEKLASVLRVSPSYLIDAAVDIRLDRPFFSAYPPAAAGPITELAEDGQLDAGHGAPEERGYEFIAALGITPEGAAYPSRLFPARLISDQLHGVAENFSWIEIGGSAMSPVLERGDEVLLDRRVVRPLEPAVFIIDEGLGPIAKWVEYIPASEPPRYRLRTEDPRFDPYDIGADRITVIGRVAWVGRRL